jgi:uncharacterized protein involved in type VI secretion and phage assembly
MNALDLFEQATSTDSDRLYGVVIGIVRENKDPQGLGRVLVELPTLSGDKILHWARVASLMAGPQRGAFFLPEKDDEVLVAFEHGYVGLPYVLGALWNGKDRPPDTNANGENNLRFIRSRSGHVVRLDDTKNYEKIEIIDKSGNNSITFDTSKNAITIKSDGDISIEATRGTIKLSAKKVEISSSADTKIQAKGGITADGSPGPTVIKGSTVNLN